MTLYEIGMELCSRLCKVFLRNDQGKRAVFGGTKYFDDDPYWRDLVPFHEYFHGDNGAGIGASHQTGWTGVVARIIQVVGALTPEAVLNSQGIQEVVRDSTQPSKPAVAEQTLAKV
jgi:hypothetical protein